jgi:predicted O-methyltransferase YrrM
MKLTELTHRRPSVLLEMTVSVARDRLRDAKDAYSRNEFSQLHARVRPYTACGNARLRSLYDAVRHVVANDIHGAVVECGTARGGSGALMGLTLESLGARRDLWLFDTFEGLPPPSAADPDRELAELYVGDFRGGEEEVRALLERLGVGESAHTVKGLFQDTLPAVDTGPIAVLHLDGDWYDSVRVCLDHLYDLVSPGGLIQIDDYGYWEGARKAVDEFLEERSLDATPLRRIDFTGRLISKP